MWLRKMGAARSVAYVNVADAAIVWFTKDEPTQVDATLVRQGVISQVSTPDERSVDLARSLVRGVIGGGSWVAVEGDARWTKYVNLDRITDMVLEDDSPLDGSKRVHRLVLSISYFAPGNPNTPQSYACGEIRGAKAIAQVLQRFRHVRDAAEVCPEEDWFELPEPDPRYYGAGSGPLFTSPPPKRAKKRKAQGGAS